MSIGKHLYRVVRSLFFGGILFAVLLYLLVYVALLLPFVQNEIRDVAQREASAFLATNVSIGSVEISPFSQVQLQDVRIPSPDGAECINLQRIGAGISLRDLLRNRKIVITYAEIIGLNAKISQKEKDGPLNIQFIIDAFKPKQPGKPPTIFDLKLRNVIIRRSSASFDKLWQPHVNHPSSIDFNHLAISDLRLDIAIPRLSNDEYIIDLRRLSVKERSGLELRKLALKGRLTPTELALSELEIELPNSYIHPSDINLNFPSMKEMGNSIINGRHAIRLSNNKITPSDFAPLLPALSHFTDPVFLSLDVVGSRDAISIRELRAVTANERLHIDLTGSLLSLEKPSKLQADIRRLNLRVTASEMTKIVNYLSPLPENINRMLTATGELNLAAKARYSSRHINVDGRLLSSLGNLMLKGELAFPAGNGLRVNGRVATDGFNVAPLLPEVGLGRVIFDASADLSLRGKDANGTAEAIVDLIEYKGTSLSNLRAKASKSGSHITGEFAANDPAAILNGNADIDLGVNKIIKGTLDVERFDATALRLIGQGPFSSFTGRINADLAFIADDELNGTLDIADLQLHRTDGESFTLNNLSFSASREEEGERHATLNCDYLDADLHGHFRISKLPVIFQSMLAKSLPALVAPPKVIPDMAGENFDLRMNIRNDNTLTEYFRLPFRLLTEVPVNASLDGKSGTATLDVDIPFLQQGKDKLVRDTRLMARLDNNLGSASLAATTRMPNKDSYVKLDLFAASTAGALTTELHWKFDRKKLYDGTIAIDADISNDRQKGIQVDARVRPSVFHVNDATWTVEPASISYADKLVDISDLRVSHGQQFVDIRGRASASPLDTLAIDLSGISLDYIFETLNINYVTFGGMASGRVKACAAFSPQPRAFTDGLWVQDLSYNGAVLGDADLTSSWDNDQKEVKIRADIDAGPGRHATVDGGVWVTRDSLSFDLDTRKINIEFLQPFMAAFSSEVKGMASGKAKLYGTFSDIDLAGRLFADTIAMKLDFTNTVYSGSDSVIIQPGKIDIPGFRLYDKYGNSALLTGRLTHRFFHDPSFVFKLRDAHGLLCYDTDARFNPDWYGRIFGSGGATITGEPGLVDILVDMTTTAGSDFTFVVSENEAAADYKFLTFTDRRKEAAEAARPDTVPEIVKLFRKNHVQQEDHPSAFNLDLRATVTPQAQIILVMDPVAGDRIKARGNGAMQIGYSSETDEMTMYGKYTVDEGSYNFTLQDLIIKDFTLKPGSSVSFNGDPLRASLDITAAYRVNTNISDLDPGFANDRELNRTNVPVEALLLVDGDLESPDIRFDIALPTLTADVERKVKSIISTEDMMNRQVIYLLALNRFYAPEYMSTGSNGGEWASVASATLSSQISNILGELSDKWSVAPSFRSDKGDFSDMEVDVNVSSRFLNNRLLINGNFGYRDRSTSTTTFVGDFDIEYLLSRNGNFRLKAYNHYNDQNYYLKSALTTQGVGIVYRHDFNNPFSWMQRLLRRWRIIPTPQPSPVE